MNGTPDSHTVRVQPWDYWRHDNGNDNDDDDDDDDDGVITCFLGLLRASDAAITRPLDRNDIGGLRKWSR